MILHIDLRPEGTDICIKQISIMIKKVCTFFIIAAVILSLISLVIVVIAPEATFDVTVLGVRIDGNYSTFWLLFSLYALFLGGVYYAAGRAGLALRRWLIIIHCTATILFFLFFGIISLFDVQQVRSLLAPYELSLLTVLSIYILLLASDILWFLVGWILLAANLLLSKKRKTNRNQHTN